jgi:hypothetical protein
LIVILSLLKGSGGEHSGLFPQAATWVAGRMQKYEKIPSRVILSRLVRAFGSDLNPEAFFQFPVTNAGSVKVLAIVYGLFFANDTPLHVKKMQVSEGFCVEPSQS